MPEWLFFSDRTILQEYTVHDPISITNDYELAAMANNGTGMDSDPYIISNWNITGSKAYGIYITGTTKHFRIENCWIVSSDICGIYVDYITPKTATIINNICINNSWFGISIGSSSIIANNLCINNDMSGIYLQYSELLAVVNNTCKNNGGNGILLEGSESSNISNNICNNNVESGINLYDSGSSIIINNTCNSNGKDGLSFSYADNLISVNNTCSSNIWRGISLWESEFLTLSDNIVSSNGRDGISLINSNYLTGNNNSCNYNGEHGFYIVYSSYNTIFYNTLIRNENYGIELTDGSNNNSIHHNSFIMNGQEDSQAYDDGLFNQWYNETVLEGNSWSDYSGVGNYFIAGPAGTYDPYPFKISETNSSNFIPLLARIGLFLFFFGLLICVSIINRRNKLK